MGARAGERVCVGGWGALWGYVRAGVLLLVALLFGGRSEVADKGLRRVRLGRGQGVGFCAGGWGALWGYVRVGALLLVAFLCGGRREVADNRVVRVWGVVCAYGCLSDIRTCT